MTITVTWTDDRQERYECENWSVRDGVLILHPPARGEVQPKRGIPLYHVRIFTE